MKTTTTLTGIAMAAAAAVLLTAGCSTMKSEGSSGATMAKVHCEGATSCKGQGACKTAKNECKGQNACKGQGWVELSDSECKMAKEKMMKG